MRIAILRKNHIKGSNTLGNLIDLEQLHRKEVVKVNKWFEDGISVIIFGSLC